MGGIPNPMLRQPQTTSETVLVIASSSLETRDNLAFKRDFFLFPPPPSYFIFSNKEFILCWSQEESLMKIDGEINDEQQGGEEGSTSSLRRKASVARDGEIAACLQAALSPHSHFPGQLLGIEMP